MDAFVYSHGGSVLSYLETGMEEEKGKNSRIVFLTSIITQLLVVYFLFWTKITCSWFSKYYCIVGAHYHDHEAVLSAFKSCLLFTRAISSLGKFCNTPQCFDRYPKLTLLIEIR